MDNPASLQTARLLRAADIACIPVSESKQPLLQNWKIYQSGVPSDGAIAMWFSHGENIAAIGGDLQCIDFDTKYSPAAYENFCALASDCGMSDVVARCILQKTPSGGRHLIFKSARNMGNLKLAKCPDGNVAIETRGDGGYFLVAPSKGYEILRGSLSSIPEISEGERDALLEIARYFDARPKSAEPSAAGRELSVGDDYDSRADVPALLRAHGWVQVGKYGWRRPGKTSGISATWDKVPNRFYVFSTSTEFETEHVYRPWHVFAVLECGGDFSEAAKKLAASGYGEPARPRSREFTKLAVRSAPQTLCDTPPLNVPIRLFCEAIKDPKTTAVPPEVVKGIVHRGCKLILSAPSKARKSWIMLDLAISVAAGARWLGYETVQSPVLHVDFELKEAFFNDRVSQILEAKFARDESSLPLYTFCLRGKRTSVSAIIGQIETFVKERNIGLIIFDPVYRLATGLDENKASEVSELLFALEELADKCNAAIAFAHHYAKGNSSAKESIDRASGSGVWARDPDALLMLTPHETDGAYVLESHLRNCPPLPPVVIQWQTPVFERNPALNPEDLKGMDKEKNKKKAFTTLDLARAMALLKVDVVNKATLPQVCQLMGASGAVVIRLWKAVEKERKGC